MPPPSSTPIKHNLYFTMPTFNDMCKGQLVVASQYILYRDRLVDASSISTFRVKGKRLLINSYKQNVSHPTMLVMFSSKEDAHAAFNGLKETLYAPPPTSSAKAEDTGILGAIVGVSLCAFMAGMLYIL